MTWIHYTLADSALCSAGAGWLWSPQERVRGLPRARLRLPGPHHPAPAQPRPRPRQPRPLHPQLRLLGAAEPERPGPVPGAEQGDTERQVHRGLHQGGDRERQGQGGLEVRGHGSRQTLPLDLFRGSCWSVTNIRLSKQFDLWPHQKNIPYGQSSAKLHS